MHNYFHWKGGSVFYPIAWQTTYAHVCKSIGTAANWSSESKWYDTATQKAIFQWQLASWVMHSGLETDTPWIIIYLGILRAGYPVSG